MNQDEFKEKITERITKLRSLTTKIKDRKNTQISHTVKDLKRFMQEGIIPQNIGKYCLDNFDNTIREHDNFQKFIADNPNLSGEDRLRRFYNLPRTLTPEETLKSYDDAINSIEIHNILITNTLPLSDQNKDNLLPSFYKSIESDEYGIARLFADLLNNSHKIHSSMIKPEPICDGKYIWKKVNKNSLGDTIRLEHRFSASCQEKANEKAQIFLQRFNGKQRKILHACWKLATQQHSRTVECSLLELMKTAYPERKTFKVEERAEAYQDLLELSQTNYLITKAKQSGGKNKETNSFVIPFLTILSLSTLEKRNPNNKQSETYPNKLTYILAPNRLLEKKKIYNVGAGFKNKTIGLRANDIPFAEFLQIRKSQVMKVNYITFSKRDELMRLAGLDKIKGTGMANKRLLEKLGRYKEKGIIKSFPSKVTFPYHIKIR